MIEAGGGRIRVETETRRTGTAAAAPAAGPPSPAQPARQAWQRYLAELIGTFALVFAGCGAVITNRLMPDSVTPVGIALVFGAVVGAMIYALGPISAAHFNPAVTLGFAATRRFPWAHVPAYVVAQVAGALAASLLHRALYPHGAAAEVAFGATLPKVGPVAALVLEGVLTFFLMLVITAVATDRRVPPAVPGLAIGGTVAFCAMMGGPLCGASMNPARSLGPALVAGGEALGVYWIYALGPVVGAIAAAGLYELLRDGPHHAQSAPADLGAAMAEFPAVTRTPA
jgi:MIP family channel proteins